MNNPEAIVVLTNQHTSKGLEWHTVYVDFYGRGVSDERLGKEFTQEYIMNLLKS